MTRASESSHYYDPRTKQPVYEVPNKSKPGEMRKANLSDARKLKLVPGVTSIIKVMDRPALNVWRNEQTIKACYENPRLVMTSAAAHVEPEPFEDYKKRIIPLAEQVATKAAERGTEIHAMLERFFLDGTLPEDEGGKATIAAVSDQLDLVCGKQQWAAEKCFVNEHWGTKIDLLSDEWLLDIKSKDGDQMMLDAEALYDEHLMQLAAGACLLDKKEPNTGIIFVSRTDPAAVRILGATQEELSRGWELFDLCRQLWQLKNRWTND